MNRPMSELSISGPSDHVELIRLKTPREAEGLQFTLTSVGVEARVGVIYVSNGERVKLWAVTVPRQQLEQARRILDEEGVPNAEQAARAARVAESGQPPSRLHWVVGLVVVNLMVWLAMEGNGGSETRDTLLRFGSSLASAIFAGEWWRMLTAVFIHIGPKHLLANMFTLLIFGPPVARAWGVGRFYFIYMLAGVVGNWVSFGLSPSDFAKAGASGAILGLLGVLAGTRIRHIRKPDPTAPPSRFKSWHIVATVIAYYGFVVGVGPSDHLAHVGGLLAGAVAALLLPMPGSLPPRRDRLLGLVLGIGTVALTAAAGLLQWRLG